jgi:putative tRNA adenosine deaminase-associated protein
VVAVPPGVAVLCCEEDDVDDAAVDFAVAAWREDGLWQVELLPPRTGESLEMLVNALRAQPGEGGVLGLVSVAEEFFLLVRVLGEEVHLLVSDVYAAEEWPLGNDALDRLGIPSPEEDESDDVQPGGDLRVVEDFGVGPVDIELLLEDVDMWPDEQLASIAARIGFGELFDATLEQLPD